MVLAIVMKSALLITLIEVFAFLDLIYCMNERLLTRSANSSKDLLPYFSANITIKVCSSSLFSSSSSSIYLFFFDFVLPLPPSPSSRGDSWGCSYPILCSNP